MVRDTGGIKLNLCRMCFLDEPETLAHFILICPILQELREHHIKKYLDPLLKPNSQLTSLLQMENTDKMKNIFSFVTNALKVRSFILNE
ncbi:Hypothetical protein NTJ_16241 [Nesidiocoris tenuis]|uniref:Reverse transcriptase zinc-binding domain-containing protein n=1 Tax=Nesidiocoris tenuis TaxID=355587 RepID=A0ABN7BGG2_9HEMI|nr:Hypothetical protein NTJ_16241 [Nesidiocoris tenuis]